MIQCSASMRTTTAVSATSWKWSSSLSLSSSLYLLTWSHINAIPLKITKKKPNKQTNTGNQINSANQSTHFDILDLWLHLPSFFIFIRNKKKNKTKENKVHSTIRKILIYFIGIHWMQRAAINELRPSRRRQWWWGWWWWWRWRWRADNLRFIEEIETRWPIDLSVD